jgi:hypothetical protein
VLCLIDRLKMSYFIYRTTTRKEQENNIPIGPHFRCKQIQENQQLLGFLKPREKIRQNKKPWIS